MSARFRHPEARGWCVALRSGFGALWPRAGLAIGLLMLTAAIPADNGGGVASGSTTRAPSHGSARSTDHVAPIRLIGRFPLSDVVALTSGAWGLYVLRYAPYPGDDTGAGWVVDLVNPDSGRILASADGDACGRGLVSAFGSLWVLTSACAMPGGLGNGVDRLNAATLAYVNRFTMPFAFAIGATASMLWVFMDGDTQKVVGVDPTSDAITRTKELALPHDVAQSMSTTPDRIVIGYAHTTQQAGEQTSHLMWIDSATLRVLSDVAVTRTAKSGDATSNIYAVDAVTSTKAYVGLFGAHFQESLAVVRGHDVRDLHRGVGDLVSVSADGAVWAVETIHGGKGGVTSCIERVAANGTVSGRLTVPSYVEPIAAIGLEAYAATPTELLVLAE
jgi:hypothetical protein